MPYIKKEWINDLTPLNATNMNHIEDGIYDVTQTADTNENNIGDLTALDTSEKTNLVNAVNEVNDITNTNTTNIGNLSNLDTTDKSKIVNAINEVNAQLSIPYTDSEIDTLLGVES